MASLKVEVEKFVWRFKDIEREAIVNFANTYEIVVKLSIDKLNYNLDENTVARLYERLDNALSIPEIRCIFAIYADDNGVKPKRLTFNQICCAFFNKTLDELENIPEDELRKLAIEDAISNSKETEAIEAAIEARKVKELDDERLKQEQLEAEAQLTGVASKQAFFKRQLSQVKVETPEQKIRKEAALRKALKEAKKKEEEDATELFRGLSPEKKQEKLQHVMEKKLVNEIAVRERLEEEEKEARADRKMTLNAKWS
jgi:hypothetical protein